LKFLLDTDSVSYALRGEGRVAEQIRAHRPSELALSAITLAELRFGAERRGRHCLGELATRHRRWQRASSPDHVP